MKAAVGFCWYLLESQDGAIQLCPCSHWNAFGAELTHIFDNGTNGLSRDKWFMKSTRCKTNDIIWDKYICSRYASSLSIAKDLVYFVRHWGVTGICKGHCVFCLKLQAQGMRGWIWSQQKMKSLRISSDPSVIVVMVWERERERERERLISPELWSTLKEQHEIPATFLSTFHWIPVLMIYFLQPEFFLYVPYPKNPKPSRWPYPSIPSGKIIGDHRHQIFRTFRWFHWCLFRRRSSRRTCELRARNALQGGYKTSDFGRTIPWRS